MKNLLLYTLLFISFYSKGQQLAQCEDSYAKACSLEVKLMNDIKVIESEEDSIGKQITALSLQLFNLKARKKDIVCRLPSISLDKQNLLSCINVEKNKVAVDALSAKLIDVMNEINRIRSTTQTIKPACEGGNCN